MQFLGSRLQEAMPTDREGYSAHHRRRDPEGQQYPEHYRHSVNRYRDPRGGDRRNYRLAAA